MDITELAELVPPPCSPPTPTDWAAVEARLGQLPSDYKTFIDLYGAGEFYGDLGVCAPDWIATNGMRDDMAAMLHEYASIGTKSVPTAPISDNLDALGSTSDTYLAWGGAGGGQVGFWRTTRGAADEWPVVVTDGDGIDYAPEGLIAYLYGLLSGTVESVGMPADWVTDLKAAGAVAFQRY